MWILHHLRWPCIVLPRKSVLQVMEFKINDWVTGQSSLSTFVFAWADAGLVDPGMVVDDGDTVLISYDGKAIKAGCTHAVKSQLNLP